MTNSNNPFAELTKLIEQFKGTNVDMSGLIESGRKDIAALVDANEAAANAMQALARKQTEILAAAMQDIVASAQRLALQGAAPDHVKQAEKARESCERMVSELNDLTDIARKAQADAMQAISQRTEQSLEEMKQRMKVGK
ncbi:TIGR01841 family phasin [Burkholderia sp. GS2Y]|uniref:TIGR01841 family phasin n=1 Tax=Burkholderia theae TaxID=3143496 RepID=A0ABU9WJC0_9BURK